MTWWERLLHQATGWQFFRVAEGDRVTLRRPPVQMWSQLEPVDWREMSAQTITEGRLDRVSVLGIGRGYPIQQGLATTRSVRVVNDGGRRVEIPRVRGGYWLTGHPTPSYDRRACIVAPDGTTHVLLQFDPDRGTCWSYVHADRDTILDGKRFTTGYNQAARVWTIDSASDPHEQALVVADMVGGDGLLTEGPPAGGLYVLDARSDSYAAMVVEGGECAERAHALATFGARLVDRKGWDDVSQHPDAHNSVIGTVPRPPSLLTQAGSQWAGTNLHRFEVALSDLRLAS